MKTPFRESQPTPREKPLIRPPWIWGEDRIPAQSMRKKVWDEGHHSCDWFLEVRSEDNGGSIRLGQAVFRGSAGGELTLRLEEVEDGAFPE